MESPNRAHKAKRRACVACTTAKSKCTPETATLCQRCSRLGKSCTYLDLPERRRRPRESRRVDALEEKILRLSTQLAVLSRNPAANLDATAPITPGTNSETHYGDTDQGEVGMAQFETDVDAPSPEPPSRSVLEGLPDIVDRGLLSPDQAQSLIQDFKSHFITKFPFIVLPKLPPDQTTKHLRQHEPFLFLCVIAATIPTVNPLRKIILDEVMLHITSRIVVGSERNMELLCGLLILAAWYRSPAQKGHTQLTLWVQLCTTIAYDLKLNIKGKLTLDEQRALLGAYWISTGLSFTVYSGPVGMKRCKQLDDCCKSIAMSTEHPSDTWIRPFMSMQFLVAAIGESYESLRDPKLCRGSVVIKSLTSPVLRQVEEMRAQIEKEVATYPSSTRNGILLDMCYIEMCIHEVALNDDEWDQSQTDNLQLSHSFESALTRTAMAWELLRRSKTFLLAFLDIPDAELFHCNVFTLARLCSSLAVLPKAVSILLKLVVNFNMAPPDLTATQRSEAQTIIGEANYLSIFAQVLKKLEILVQELTVAEREMDVVGNLCLKMRMLARCYPHRLEGILGVDLIGPSIVGSAENDPQQDQEFLWTGSNGSQEWSLPATGVEDGSTLLGDDLWASVLQSFTNYG